MIVAFSVMAGVAVAVASRNIEGDVLGFFALIATFTIPVSIGWLLLRMMPRLCSQATDSQVVRVLDNGNDAEEGNTDQPQRPPAGDEPGGRRPRPLSATIPEKSMSITESQPAVPKPGHRPFQYSLAGMLALTTIISVGLSLMKWNPWFGVLFVNLGLWIVAIYIDRRFSPKFSWRTLVGVVVVLILLGVLSAVMFPGIR